MNRGEEELNEFESSDNEARKRTTTGWLVIIPRLRSGKPLTSGTTGWRMENHTYWLSTAPRRNDVARLYMSVWLISLVSEWYDEDEQRPCGHGCLDTSGVWGYRYKPSDSGA